MFSSLISILLFVELKNFVYEIYRDALANTFPFAKESPFIVPMMNTFGKMQRFGVLDHISKSYFSSSAAQHIKCGDPKVLTFH